MRVELKQRAREQIKENFWKIIGTFFVVTLIGGVISTVGSYTFVGIFFLSNVLIVGYYYLAFNIANDNEFSIGDIFFGFKQNYMKIVGAMALQMWYMILWILLSYVTLGIGLIWAIPKIMSYSMVPLILIHDDLTETNAKEILEKSIRMMDGHKVEYFVLSLSFIGWALLSIVTFGIVGLYVAPYSYVTVIHYYEYLSNIELDLETV